MEIKNVVVGKIKTNCYILSKSGKCLIIDPGDEFDKIKSNVSDEVVGVLLTHKHFDHVGALKDCLDYYKVNVYSIDNLKEGKNKVDDFVFDVLYNPGHTLDSISFIFGDIMFSGDFIFEGSIGRWDLGGDLELMRKSIKNIININKNYLIYPGHGNTTSLYKEIDNMKSYL